MRAIHMLKWGFFVVVVAFLSIGIASAQGTSGYSFTYTPTAGDFNQFNFANVSHPTLTILPKYNGTDFYPKYWLSIKNPNDSSTGNTDKFYDKTAWNRTDAEFFTFDPAYTWDLCKGNADQTSGYVTIRLEGEGSDHTTRTTLLDEEIFITNYKDQCSATTNESAPTKSQLALTVGTSTSSSTDVKLSDPALSKFAPGSGSSYQYRLFVDGSDKGLFLNGLSTSWDTSGTGTDDHSLMAQFRNTTTGTSVDGPPLTVTKGSTGTVTSLTPPPAPSPGGSTAMSPSPELKELIFDVPDLSFIRGQRGLVLRLALFNLIIKLVFMFASIFATISFLIAGISYSLSFGDATKAEKAKKALSMAAIGTVILLLSIVILTIVSRLIKTITG